jgi:hypothetical protein
MTDDSMPAGRPGKRRAAGFRKSDLVRVLRAAQEAKTPVRSARIADGEIVMVFGKPDDVASSPPINLWDDEQS